MRSSTHLTDDPDVDEPSTESDRATPSPWVSVAALVGFVLVAQLAGLIGLPFTDRAIGGWYDGLDKPAFNPPGWVFGPVWTTLYLLIGVAAWRIWRRAEAADRECALSWWGIQLVLNAAWTPLFFGARAPWVALVEIVVLWVAIVVTTAQFRRIDTVAALLMVPYLAWVSFATVLNASIAWLN
jgi:tryptophan-rich sensory protein